jgi:hypothetical protein
MARFFMNIKRQGSGHSRHLPLPNQKVWLLTLSLASLLVSAHAAAVTTLSQGFTTTAQLRIGSIVSLVNNSSDQVIAANRGNVENMLGIVIDNGNTLLSLNSSQSSQVQVATDGIVEALVSNFNGTVNQDDDITASPIDGVGMKATDNTRIVGVAQVGLNNTNGTAQTYKDAQGQTHTILMGEIPLLVNVSNFYRTPDKTIIPSAVQNVANAFAGKSVSPLPIIVSVAIFLITLIVVVSIIYSMIHASIISVGRNPMAQGAIYRDIIQMSVLVLGILTVSVISIYLSLTKL